MTSFNPLIRGLLLTALLLPAASADETDVCVRDGQVYVGAECGGGPQAQGDPTSTDGPLDVCVKDGQVVTGPECA